MSNEIDNKRKNIQKRISAKQKASKEAAAEARKRKQNLGENVQAYEEKAKKEREEAKTLKNLLKKVDNEKSPKLVTEDELITPSAQELAEQDAIFKPNPGPQTEFLSASEREVLYGGAAGGGKSYAMIADPLRYCTNPNHRAILFRRTNDQLREIIGNTQKLYPFAFPGAKWHAQKSTWTFPSGAIIWITYLDRDDDVYRYHGQAFNWIGFDELTNWPSSFPIEYMRSRLRTTDPELPLYMRYTTNPGGVGAHWVKKMFIDPEEWGKPFPALDIETGAPLVYPPKHELAGQPLYYRRFIPASLEDNPYLAEDGQYEANLLSLSETQRKQLLEGDWEAAEGAAFPEFTRKDHVIEPFDIPNEWAKYRGCDWGYSNDEAVTVWVAVDYDSNVYVYREYMDNGKSCPPEDKKTGPEYARKLAALEGDEHMVDARIDGSVFSNRGDEGPTIGESINNTLREVGVPAFLRADRSKGSRESRKAVLHEFLKKDPLTDKPRIFFFSSCPNTIRSVSTIPLDKRNDRDVDTKAWDHPYDALTYILNTRFSPDDAINPWNEFDSYDDYSGDYGGYA